MQPLERARVVVLMGGRSSEREVSLTSGAAVLAGLRDAPGGPAEVVPAEVLADGRWRVGEEDLAPGVALARLDGADLVFLALHGGEGEDGTIQGLLDLHGVAYTGSGVRASAVCMDKALAREVAAGRGLAVAPGALVRRDDAAELAAALEATGTDRWVLKPRHGGSSVDTAVTSDPAVARDTARAILASGDEALVEAVVAGVETTVPVLGNRGDALSALTPVEIRPHDGRFFDYEEKYSEGGADELVPPESLDAPAQERLRAAALDLHDHLRLDGYSRTDFIVRADGAPVFLEVNTLPGLTPRSLLPQSAAHDGMTFPALCAELARLGLALAG